MNIGLIAAAVSVLVVLAIIALIVFKKRPRKLKTDKFTDDWQSIQAMCKDKANWPTLLTQADELLDKALKRRRMKGKTMGERLVSAQRLFTNNDDVWFAHNYVKKLIAGDVKRPKESDVKDALIGFRQALRDIGALPSSKPTDKPMEKLPEGKA